MSNPRYSAKFKEEAVRQFLDRGYIVKDVSERIGQHLQDSTGRPSSFNNGLSQVVASLEI